MLSKCPEKLNARKFRVWKWKDTWNIYNGFGDLYNFELYIYRQRGCRYFWNPLGDHNLFNSSPTSDAYMGQWIGSALIQIMACRLVATKPLSNPMLGYFQLDSCEQTSEKYWSKYTTVPFTKMHMKISFAKWWPVCPGGDELTSITSSDVKSASAPSFGKRISQWWPSLYAASYCVNGLNKGHLCYTKDSLTHMMTEAEL